MNLLELIVGPVTKLLERVIPDPQVRAEMQLKMLQLQQSSEFKQIDDQLQRDLAQIDVNKTEAASSNPFASSWRPLCGYVCVLGLSYQFLLQPLIAWGSGIWHVPLPPNLDLGSLITLLGGLLGLGTLRTAEKMKGVAS